MNKVFILLTNLEGGNLYISASEVIGISERMIVVADINKPEEETEIRASFIMLAFHNHEIVARQSGEEIVAKMNGAMQNAIQAQREAQQAAQKAAQKNLLVPGPLTR